LIGRHDRGIISSFKRTRQFNGEDFDLLERMVSFFRCLFTTPNILTETSNLACQLGEPVRTAALHQFSNTIRLLSERYVESRRSSEHYDHRFAGLLQKSGRDVLNFNHVRMLGWS
jgi:hypothetical protein